MPTINDDFIFACLLPVAEYDPPLLMEVEAAERARGLPDPSAYGDLSVLKPGDTHDFFIQHHDALRAGPHYDFRVGSPKTGLFSWAVPKGVPAPGDKRLAIQQPLHSHRYGSWSGTIPPGYGAGRVELADRGKVMVTKVTPDSLHLSRIDKKHETRYVMVKPKRPDSRNWLMVQTTPTEPLPYQKIHYRKVPAEHAEAALQGLAPGASVQAKIDGASALVHLTKHGPELYSYRTSRTTGRPIVHTTRFFRGPSPQTQIPPELVGSVLRGELYAQPEGTQPPAAGAAGAVPPLFGAGDAAPVGPAGYAGGGGGGRYIEPADLGSLLNATPQRSIAEQRRRNVGMRLALFDIQRHGNRPIDFNETPYAERRKMLADILPHLNRAEHPDTFTHDGERYDLTALTQKMRGRPVYNAPVADLRWVMDHDTPDPGRMKTVNVNEPAFIHPTVEGGRPTVVDGLHRLARAVAENRTHIPAMDVPPDVLRSTKVTPRFHLTDEVNDPQQAVQLWRDVIGGRHPLTREGVVVHPATGKPFKVKQTEDHDVLIKGTYPGLGRRAESVGGLTYAWPDAPDKVVGRVGTGFDDRTLAAIAADPAGWVGRVAKLRAQEKLPSGALRAPVFHSLHEDITGEPAYGVTVPTPKTAGAKATSTAVEGGLRQLHRSLSGGNERHDQDPGGAGSGGNGLSKLSNDPLGDLPGELNYGGRRTADAEGLLGDRPAADTEVRGVGPRAPLAPGPLPGAVLVGSRGRALHYGRPEPEGADHDYAVFTDDPAEQQRHMNALRQMAAPDGKLHERPGGFLTLSRGGVDTSVYPTSKLNDIHRAWAMIEGGMSKEEAWARVADALEKAAADGRPTVLAVDLDGTLAEGGDYDPKKIGDPRPGARKWVKLLHDAGVKVVVHTVRGDTAMVERWAKEHDIPVDAVNENKWTQPPGANGKLYADVYLDDRALDGSGAWPKIGPEVARRLGVDADEPLFAQIKNDGRLSVTMTTTVLKVTHADPSD